MAEKTTVVLDTNAILRYPEALARTSPDIELIVPAGVLRELNLSAAASGSVVPQLIANASQAGIVRIPSDSPFRLSTTPPGKHLSATDVDVIEAAVAANRDKDHRVVIATEDRDIATAAGGLGVQTITSTELRQLLNQPGSSAPLSHEVDAAVRNERRRFIQGTLAGIALGVVASATIAFGSTLVATAGYWVVPVLMLPTSLILYRLRAQRRLIYGLAEFIFGLFTGVWALYQASWHPTFAQILPVMAALYVMVRGLDNIGTGVRGTSREPWWRKYFEGQA